MDALSEAVDTFRCANLATGTLGSDPSHQDCPEVQDRL